MQTLEPSLLQQAPCEPTEVGQIMATMVGFWPPLVRMQLRRLLEHHLGSPIVSARRERQLGLVIELILQEGRPPSATVYDQARKEAFDQGVVWPERSEISGAYGSWARVVAAALRLLAVDPTKPTATTFTHLEEDNQAPMRSYQSMRFIARALLECRDWVGRWPSEYEYYEWASLERATAREAGSPVRLLPERVALMARFASFEAALRFAERFEQLIEQREEFAAEAA